MKLSQSVAAIVVACAVSLGGVVAPAHASSPITVYSPDDDEYQAATEVIVDGHNGSELTETIEVQCDESSRSPRADVPPGSFSVSVGSFAGPDTCWIRDYYSDDLLATFTVAGPAVTVADPSVTNDAFYPLVRDRYKDTVAFGWRQDRTGRATIKVVSAQGRVVRTAAKQGSQGRNAWTWNGRNARGGRVAKGGYRLKVTVNANTVGASVLVRTELVTKNYSQRKEGNRASSLATRGSCYATRDSYERVASLDCWGGRYARARYRFAIPAAAFGVRATIDLRHTSADLCCRGRITKGWERTSQRTVTMWAKVTKWRATEVDFVRVTYKRKTRI